MFSTYLIQNLQQPSPAYRIYSYISKLTQYPRYCISYLLFTDPLIWCISCNVLFSWIVNSQRLINMCIPYHERMGSPSPCLYSCNITFCFLVFCGLIFYSSSFVIISAVVSFYSTYIYRCVCFSLMSQGFFCLYL